MTSIKGKQRKILALTGSRADYSHTRKILKLVARSSQLELKVVATDMHLLPEHGMTLRELQKDGIASLECIPMTLAGSTYETMAKSLGVFHISFVDVLAREKPDILLLVGDRGDQLMASIIASYLYIPTAHIQGGDISGNIDGMVRHAISKFSHIHFPATEDSANRLRKMGEEAFRIHLVGSPQLDELMELPAKPREKVFEEYGFSTKEPLILVIQHPVTEQVRFAGEHMAVTLSAVKELGYNAVIIGPNNDAGSASTRLAIELERGPNMHVEKNLGRDEFTSLLNAADVLVGNSSCGIIEAASLALPVVNIGIRQEGRIQAMNTINAGNEKKDIISGIRQALEMKSQNLLKGMKNPYGDGESSQRIVNLLETIELNEQLKIKRMAY